MGVITNPFQKVEAWFHFMSKYNDIYKLNDITLVIAIKIDNF